jgi:NAD(P)-dependent dehydrogenase (short-subunit alcohol dehydrogenase family)
MRRRALVTGSAAGIGWAIADALAAGGTDVVAHGLEADRVAAAAASWRRQGVAVAESCADLSLDDGVDRLAADLGAWGEPDIVVLSASIEIAMDWKSVDLAALREQGAVNFHSSVLIVQRFLPGMIDRGWGRVVALGSVQEERPNPFHLAYAATKAAQTNVILNLARTVGAPNVTFNVLRPGAIATDRNRARLAAPGAAEAVAGRIPLGRVGAPTDCVGAALLLCSDAGSYINGAVLAVDGGMRL